MARSDLPGEAVFRLHADPDAAGVAAERLFERVAAELEALLPASADVRHIGATAVPGCLTKGDLGCRRLLSSVCRCAEGRSSACRSV